MKKKNFLMMLFMSFMVFVNTAYATGFSKLFKKAKPSVVVINTSERGNWGVDSVEKVSAGFGSGFILSKDGLIMTAAHVVHMADVVNVKLHDGRVFSATVRGVVSAADVALIKLDHVPDDLVPVTLGDSNKVSIGDEIFVVGSPYDIQYTLTTGHIGGRRHPGELANGMGFSEFLQTDASINKGNSGGPMFNMKGEVIGIISHILTESGGFEGIGFAVAINSAKEYLLNQGTFWGGIDGVIISGKYAAAMNVPQEDGYLVQRVAMNSLGDRLGLKTGDIPVRLVMGEVMIGGDIILNVLGLPISTGELEKKEILKAMTDLPVNGIITMKVLRAGKILKLSAPKVSGE